MEETRFATLSEAEWDIMRVLWHSPTPLRAGEIAGAGLDATEPEPASRPMTAISAILNRT